VFDDQQGYKITLEEALSAGIIDSSEGRFILGDKNRITFDQAVKMHRLENPLTIKECVDQQLVDDMDSFLDPVTGESISLLEAVGRGILDADLKSVRDVKAAAYVSLGQALSQAIVKHNGGFTDTLTGEFMSLAEAVKKGLLTSVCQKTIFEIEGIKNPGTGDYVSFNEALVLGLLDRNNSTFFDKKTLTRMTLHEAVDKDYIQPQLLDMLERPVGITVLGTELTLLQAVMNRRLDPMSGLLLDPATQSTLPLEVAVAKGLITPMGAAILKSLLNITVTTATVTQTVRRTIKVSSSPSPTTRAHPSGEGTVTFQEALRRGLIDEVTGLFTDAETGKEIALDEAISLGLIRMGQAPAAKSPVTMGSRKNSVSSVASSRKSSDSSSRSSSSPPKSLASAKEFLKESSSREARASSLTTSFRMTSQSTQNVSSSSSQSSVLGTTITSRHGSPSKQTSSSNRRGSTSGGSRNISPEKTPTRSPAKSPATSEISPRGSATKRLDRLDSFEKRMEERGETFAADSKLDYSYRSLSTSSSTRTIPILQEENTGDKMQLENVPPDGYGLDEAIASGMFDPAAGLLKIPGTNQELSFKECLDLNIINSSSASVLSYGQTFSLKTAVERCILDSTGHYINSSGSLITMKEAMEAGFITSDTYIEDGNIQSFKQVQESLSTNTIRKLTENIEYDTASGTYEVNPNIQPGELMAALKDGKILPSDIKVEDPSTGTKGGGSINDKIR
jgi:hypothetical protein